MGDAGGGMGGGAVQNGEIDKDDLEYNIIESYNNNALMIPLL
jgi:hypothetical protein